MGSANAWANAYGNIGNQALQGLFLSGYGYGRQPALPGYQQGPF